MVECLFYPHQFWLEFSNLVILFQTVLYMIIVPYGLPFHHHVVNKVFALFQIQTLQQENSVVKKQAQKFKEQFQQQKVRLLPKIVSISLIPCIICRSQKEV